MNPFRKFSRLISQLCLGAAVVASGSVLCAQDNDRIFTTKGGAAVRGKIVERTRDKVVIEVRGTNQSFTSNEIARIVFDGEPQQLTRAKDFIGTGQIDQAIDEFKKIDDKSIKSDVIKQDYDFYKGYIAAANALRGKGDANAAKNLLLNWVKDNSTSNCYYMAAEKLGELAMAMGTTDQAVKYFGAVANAPFPELKVRGNYLGGKALLTLKQTANAKAKFDLVSQAQVADPVSLKFKKLASVASVRCEATDGKSAEALQALEKMVDEGDATDAELFAELFNAIGGIQQGAGNNDEAILAFLKTDLLYASQTEAHAEALYSLSQLWPKIGDNQRAIDAKSRLAKLYPTSPWLKK